MAAEGVKQLAGDVALQLAVDKVEDDGVLRVIRGDSKGPLSALLDALRTHLHIDLSIREYTEHTLDVDQQQNAPAVTYIELVPAGDRKSTTSWLDLDISGAGLRAVLSTANNATGDMELPELKLTVGFNAKSGILSMIVNLLGLGLPWRFQAAFFEVMQRAARDAGDIHRGVDRSLQEDVRL